MEIEVESLKELEAGKTYAVQLVGEVSWETAKSINDSIQEVGRCYGMSFIVFSEDVRLIDAPVPV